MPFRRLTVALASPIMCATLVSAQRVDDRHDFQPGDLIQFGEGAYPPPGSTWKVSSCEPVTKAYRQCDLIQQSPSLEERARPFTMDTYVKVMTLVGRADATPAAAARPSTPPAETRPMAIAAPAGGACPKSAYGGPVPGNRPASAALFRQKITDSITMAAYGNYWYGVKLDGFTVGSPVRNTVSVVPGIGATRVTNGAPPNATLYPVSTTMSVCDGALSGSSSWRTSQKKYFCFVSANNEWTCGATN